MLPSESGVLIGQMPGLRTSSARGQVSLAKEILKDAFEEDPLFRWLFPDLATYNLHFSRMADAFGVPANRRGTLDFEERGRGVALWLPPGQQASNARLIGAAIRGISPSRWLAATRLLVALLSVKPSEPHWYLAMIGVRRSCRGEGLGDAMLRKTLRRCDEDGCGAYLEATSPRNIALYARHGFVSFESIRLPGLPPVQPMFRPPRQTT